jgi:hypothetical protein
MSTKIFNSGFNASLDNNVGESLAASRAKLIVESAAINLPDIFNENIFNQLTEASVNTYRTSHMFSYMTNWIKDQVFGHSCLERDLLERKANDLAQAR